METIIEQSQNILNWYDFNKEDVILEVGMNSLDLTKMLCSKVKSVTVVEPDVVRRNDMLSNCQNIDNLEIFSENITKLNHQKQYNKIILVGAIARTEELFGENLKLEQIIKKIEEYLIEDGKILIAVDNKFGIRYFAGNKENIYQKRFVGLYGYSNEEKPVETYTKKSLENIFNKLGYNYYFYYPLPDYKVPDVIFSDNYLPQYNNVDKYNTYTIGKPITVFNEIDVFREILKSNPEMFPFFCNSFLIEISKKDINTNYKYISFNNARKKQFRLITKISNDYVEKQCLGDVTQAHYNTIKNNIKTLKEKGFKTVDFVEDETIKSKYINQEMMLSNILNKKLEENNITEFDQIMEKFIETISKDSYKESDYDKTVFAKYGIKIENKEIIGELDFLKDGFWDMTFTNCFYTDNDFYFFDQEWNENNLPVQYVLYRAIFYCISLRRFIKIEDLFEKYNLTKYLDLFKKLDDKIQEAIKDEDVWKNYNKSKVLDIDGTLQEISNLQIREEAKDKAIENYQKQINKKISVKCKRFIKSKFGGKNGQKN